MVVCLSLAVALLLIKVHKAVFVFLIAFGSGERCWLETSKLSFRNAVLCFVGAAPQLTTFPITHQKYCFGERSIASVPPLLAVLGPGT